MKKKKQAFRSSRRIPSALLRPLPFVGLAAVLSVFAVLKLYSLNFVNGDEHMYNYMALMVTEGNWPYRDFFFSHPPLQIYIMALLYQVFGYSLALSKSVPSAAAAISGVFVFLLGRRILGNAEALLGCVLFLFSFDVIRGSSHYTGANLALAFLLAGTYLVIVRRPMIGGVLLGLGSFAGVYVVPQGLMLIVLSLFRSWKDSLKLTAAFFAVLGGGIALFVSAAGADFWYQVVTYNVNKVPMEYSWFEKFENVFFLNTPVMLGFLPAIAWSASLWKVQGRRRQPLPDGEPPRSVWPRFSRWVGLFDGDRIAAVIMLATFTFGYFFFYSTRDDYYSYYFMLIMPWMGLLTAYVAIDGVRYLWRFRASGAPEEAGEGLPRRERRRKQRAADKKARRSTSAPRPARPPLSQLWPVAVGLAVLVGVVAFRSGIAEQRLARYRDTVKHYSWIDSPYLGPGLNGAVRFLFWDPVRDRRSPPSAIARYLQHETRHAATIDRFLEGVRAECRPGTRIFGEYSLGPFAAAASDCVLGAKLADTNPHRWKVGESRVEDWIEQLEDDNLEIAIVRRGSSTLRPTAMRRYLFESFPRVVYTWRDPYVGFVQLRRRAD